MKQVDQAAQQCVSNALPVPAGESVRRPGRSTTRITRSSLLLSLVLLAILLLVSLPLSPFQPPRSAAQTEPPFPPAGQWYTYANGDDILALAREGDTLWAGTRAGGLVRWNTTNGSYTQFLKPQDDLAGNIVYDIAIDDHGLKWLATAGGLSVLDDNGTPDKADDTWHTYTRQNTAGQLPSNQVTAVAVDEAGLLWIGSSQYWDPDTEAYTGGGLTELDPRGTLDPGDDAWLHTFTLSNTLTIQQGQQILGLASDNITDILPVPGHRVWVASRQHWLYEEPTENIPGRWVQIHGGLSRLDHAGTPDTNDDAWKTWNCEDDSQFGCVVTQLRMDSLDYVWAAMRGRGVLTFRYDAATLRPDRDRFTTADGLESNFVSAIAFGPPDDPEWANTVWFSTYHSFNGQGYGVSVLDHGGTPGNHSDDTWNARNPTAGQPLTTADGLAGNRVQAMLAGDGVIWMGTGGISGRAYGISPFDLTKQAFDDPLTAAATGIPSNYITDVAFGQAGTRWENQVWVGTGNRWERRYGAGALLLDTHGTLGGSDDTWSQFTKAGTDDDGQPPWTSLAGDNVVAVAVDGDNVWFGAREATWDSQAHGYTDGGLSVYDGERWTVRTVENTGGESTGLRSNRVSTLAVGCNGELWIGLGSLQENQGVGIDVLDTGSDPHNLENDTWWDPFRYPAIPSDLITDIAPDCGQGQVWVSGAPHFAGSGNVGGGVGRYDEAAQAWTIYTTADGLQSYASRNVTGDARSIAVGPDGTIWAGTWGMTNTTSADISNWPYVPATVNWYQDGAWDSASFPHDGWVSSIAVDADGAVWAGTSRGGMDGDRDGQAEDTEIKKAGGGIKLTQDGAGWVSWSPADSPLVSDDIEVIAVGPDGDVWIGTNGWGLMRFHAGEEPPTPAPTSTQTPTPVSLTSTPTPTATPTSTMTPATPTPTSTVTSTSPTPTATRGGTSPQQVYLPLVANNRASPRVATATATPTPSDISPQFNCGGWCEMGSSPGMRSQTVTSDRAVDDWIMRIDGMVVGVLLEEAPTYAVVEAPEGRHIRVEALFQGEWLLACESDVGC